MTSSEEDLPITTNRQPSEELLKLIKDLKNNLVKAKDLFVIIVNKARDEGFEDKEIDALLYSKLKEIIPRKTLYRYREEFIPLAIKKRGDNVLLDQSSITSGSNDTTNNLTEEDYYDDEEDEAEEEPETTTKTLPTAYDVKDAETNGIFDKLPKSVLKLAEKIELSQNKLRLIANPRLKEHSELQKGLVESIAPLSLDQAKIKVAKKIRDLETGYLIQSESGDSYWYSGDTDKREIIKSNRVAAKFIDYLDIMGTGLKFLETLTGHKLGKGEFKYTKKIIENTEKHRIDIIKSCNSDIRELNSLNQDVLKPAQIVIQNMIQKIYDELEIAKQKQDMMKK